MCDTPLSVYNSHHPYSYHCLMPLAFLPLKYNPNVYRNFILSKNWKSTTKWLILQTGDYKERQYNEPFI